MAISDKLNYLIETKDLFKDRLNSLGAEIIESTTFRNYLNWLDTFYGEASDKTDLSVNGVIGRTSQERTTGKNVFKKANDLYNNMRDTGQFTLTDMGNNILKATKNVTGTTSPRFYITDSIVSSTTYYVSLDVLGNCNSLIVGIWIDEMGQTDLVTITPTSNYQKISFSFTSNGNVARIYFRNTNENIEVGQYFQIKNVMISTSNDTTYEPYTGGQPSPSPDYTQEINNLSGNASYKVSGKNLFDKNNYIELNGTPNFSSTSTSGTFTGGGANYNIVIPCQPNTTYTIQKRNDGNTNRFAFCCSETIPSDVESVNTPILNGTRKDTASEITITTAPTAKYLIAHYYRNVETALTKQQILDSIQIEKNSTSTPYESHISESFPLSLGDIELCNISDYKDKIYSQNGKFYLEKKTGKVVLDGSENVSRVLTNISGNYRFSITGPTDMKKNVNVALIPAGLVISNKFVEISNSDSYNVDSINGILVRMNNTNNFIINCIETQTYTVEQFKEWLSTHNTKIQYVLTTPTTTEITQENYPTLYSQLLAIQEFLTKYKINKEFLLDYSSPEIKY